MNINKKSTTTGTKQSRNNIMYTQQAEALMSSKITLNQHKTTFKTGVIYISTLKMTSDFMQLLKILVIVLHIP